jgi:hypothetical protein
MAATESGQTHTQTCAMLMKEKVEYCRYRIRTNIHSNLCCFNERVGRIWPGENPHRLALRLVL